MEPLKLGIIGVGGMGGNHARSIPKLDEVEVVAVADVDEEIANAVGEEIGARPFNNARAMMDASGLEAILIATPHPFHPEATFDAAERGIHVLCEKPLAISVKTADAMVEACDSAGVMLGVMFQQRADPSRALIKHMTESGELGEVHRISMVAPWYRPQAYYDAGAWRGTWKGEGGGILMNQAPHSIDLFRWLGGTPKSVFAIADTRLHQIEVENTAAAICDFGEGKTGFFYASTADVPSSETFEVAGDRGVLRWENGRVSFFELDSSLSEHLKTSEQMFGRPNGGWREIEMEKDQGGHNEVVRLFARAVRENNPALMSADGRDGVAALELANAILLAGYTRREVTLPLDRDAYEAMLQKLQAGSNPSEFRQQ